MKHTEENITNICRTETAAAGLLFIDIRFRKQNSTKVIELFVDSADSLTIDHCASLSRVLSERLEAVELPEEPFLLNVSSPGIDRPLVYREQYPKHAGRVFDLELHWQGTTRKLRARLLQATEDALVFEQKSGEPITIPYNDVVTATVSTSLSI